jgi:predicted amidophosphoribosyltransferase
MRAKRYLKNTLQLKFRNNVELARVLAETLMIAVTSRGSSPNLDPVVKVPPPPSKPLDMCCTPT